MNLGDGLRWEVIFVFEGKLRRRSFEDDFVSAQMFHVKLSQDERISKPALRCCNRAFPPPAKLRPRHVRTRRGVRRVVPMLKVNLEHGKWWCPYCMRLRVFKKRNGFEIDGVYVPEPSYLCPACGVSHRDFHVRYWNPHAAQAYENPPRATRSDKGKVKQ